ncbi:MAG: glycosyltransferase family 4 protein [Bacteroidetes bacterium]|nr:glycosyltransferase family 4 protein [Bacteroidota bacterium]MCH8170651.1 glycosyltransferase family 4 protein [Bacteroidota bacterium]MCH8325739.1 glycosyltransferase family 4 protein [Bacteroidota bacterium]
MNVTLINSADTNSGAARAAYAILKALRKNGTPAKMLVQTKSGNDDFVHPVDKNTFSSIHTLSRKAFDFTIINLLTKHERGRFSFPIFGINIYDNDIIKNADLLHLNWINEGFFSLNTFRKLAELNKPIVWTLHDMWAFTGGCHYSGKCDNYKMRCINCPSLKFPSDTDASSTIFARKLEIYKRLNLNIVTCSKWLAEEARQSVLLSNFDIRVIPNPIDTDIYKPIDKTEAKKYFNLPKDRLQILFATMTVKETRKGFDYFNKSIRKLYELNSNLKNKIELTVLGAAEKEMFDDFPFKVNSLGRLSSDKEIVSCYNAADVFVAPSLQDNLPNTVMEAMACGVPSVAFNIGGMPDMIEHNINGYLANKFSVEDLAVGINLLLENHKLRKEFGEASRVKVLENFNEEKISNIYLQLYESLLRKM